MRPAPRNTPILIASTSEVYGKSEKAAFSEEDDLLIGPPHLSRWSYACSKLMDEFLALAHAKEHETPVVIARLFKLSAPAKPVNTAWCLPVHPGGAGSGRPLQVFGRRMPDALLLLRAGHGRGAGSIAELPRRARTRFSTSASAEEISITRLAETVIPLLLPFRH